MPETQNIEYKSSWHDDYLDWACGFANAQGGKITNSDYQSLNNVSKRTASNDLTELAVRFKVLLKKGS
ncbi:MAG: hypothetical protein PHE56_10245, partial [Bacteroidales bacterium]|nr:hypothetical protein [Bacteroidales bacterium]